MPDCDHDSEKHPDGNFELLRMLDKDNAGLEHIRELVLSDGREYTKNYDEIQQYPDAVLFAHLLPKNTLTAFQ